jgi:hypothetical protein
MRQFLAAIVSISSLTSVSPLISSGLLTHADWEFQLKDNSEGPEMESRLDSPVVWSSFNQWQCFNDQQISFTCVKYDDGILVPNIEATIENEFLSFDVAFEAKLDCKATLASWNSLVQEGKEICVFAAKMNDFEAYGPDNKRQSLWYIKKIKGINGYWP